MHTKQPSWDKSDWHRQVFWLLQWLSKTFHSWEPNKTVGMLRRQKNWRQAEINGPDYTFRFALLWPGGCWYLFLHFHTVIPYISRRNKDKKNILCLYVFTAFYCWKWDNGRRPTGVCWNGEVRISIGRGQQNQGSQIHKCILTFLLLVCF